MSESEKTYRFRVGVRKIIITVFGIVVLGLGLSSHFLSDWRFVNQYTRICDEYKYSYRSRSTDYQYSYYTRGSAYKQCPPFAMEEYFVAAIIICFILSLGSLYHFATTKNPSSFGIKMDICYHWLAAVMLLIAGALYIVSSVQVFNMRGLNYYNGRFLEFKFEFKVIAGVLTVIQGFMCGIVGFYIRKGNTGNYGNNMTKA